MSAATLVSAPTISAENDISAYSLPQLSTARPIRPLVLIGGGEIGPEVARLVSSWSDPHNGEILVIAWASRIPDDYFKNVSDILQKAGSVNVTRMPNVDSLKEDEAFSLLARASAVFFTGGDQTRLKDCLDQTGLGRELIRRLMDDSLLIAGTSAGSAIASSIMIAGSGEAPESFSNRRFTQLNSSYLTEGGGFLNFPAIVDQHFSQRERTARLVEAIGLDGHKIQWGIGIDESTAAAVIDHRYILVCGDHKVTVLPGPGSAAEFDKLELRSGDVFDMQRGVKFDPGNGFELVRTTVRN